MMATVPLFETLEAEVMLTSNALHMKAATIFLDSFSTFWANSLYFQLYLIESPRENSDFSHFPLCQRLQHSQQKLLRQRSQVPLLINPQQSGLVHFLLFFNVDAVRLQFIFMIKLEGKRLRTSLSSTFSSPGQPVVRHFMLLFCSRQCQVYSMRHQGQSWLCWHVKQFLQQVLTFLWQQRMHYRELLGMGREICRWIYFIYFMEVSSQNIVEAWRFFMMWL